MPEVPGAPVLETLQEALGARHLLMVLDNCEHLIDACAHLANALLSACPRLRLLATSRQALGLTGEMPWRVPSLSLPDPEEGSMVDGRWVMCDRDETNRQPSIIDHQASTISHRPSTSY